MAPDSKRAKITEENRKEAAALKALWDASTSRRTQAVFGEVADLGNQANVGHYLNARSALNPKAAAAFSKELGVPVESFSPRLAEQIRALSVDESMLRGAVRAASTAAATLSPSAELMPYLPGFEALSIPVLAQAGSMGPGEDQLHDEIVVGRLTVSPQWVTRTIKPLTKIQNLRFIHGYGDSMEPTFSDGDVLLVDAGVKDHRVDGVYVLEANDRIYIKRVRQRLDGTFEVSSDNPTVKTVDDLNRPGARICGRVVWAWNGKKL